MCQSLYTHAHSLDANLICTEQKRCAFCITASSGRFLKALGAGLATIAFLAISFDFLDLLFTGLVPLSGLSAAVGGIGAGITALVNLGETPDQVLLHAVEQVQTLAKHSYGNGTAIMETYGWMP